MLEKFGANVLKRIYFLTLSEHWVGLGLLRQSRTNFNNVN